MGPLSQLPFTSGEVAHLLPIAIPALFGLIVLCADLYLGPRNKVPLALLTAMGAVLAFLTAYATWQGAEDQVVLAGSIAVSRLGTSLALAILLGTTLMAFATAHHGRAAPHGDGAAGPTLAHGELYGLMLFATSGMLALAVSNDLVTLFVALEVLSVAVYALTGAERRRARSAEGAMKYFVLGAFSSGFLLYGMALVYGATGTLRLDAIADGAMAGPHSGTLLRTGAALLFVGLLFKVGAVPFHAWTPDAYEGAPSAVTGFMSVGVKVAAFGAALRVTAALGESGALGGAAAWLLWVVAALTVILGNAGALTQRNPRRLLAYSSIAHSGYVLIGLVAVARCYDPQHPAAGPELVAAGRDAAAGVLFYLVAYAVSNLAAFGVLCHLERGGDEVEDTAELAGLGRVQPGVAFALTVALVSLAGIPGTAGFLGKLWVFRAGIGTGDVGLVVLALVTSVLSLFYYLRVVVIMYMVPPGAAIDDETPAVVRNLAPDPLRWCSRLAVGVAAVLCVVLGIYPGAHLLALVATGAQAVM